MSRLDLGDRVLYPQGGFARLIEVIAGLAERHGARLHTGAPVTALLTGEGAPGSRAQVTGVEHALNGSDERRTLIADAVVGAADLHHLETTLLPPSLQTHPEPAWRSRSPGPGAVLAMLGVEGRLPELAHHSLFFTSDWDRNFGDIFGAESRVPDPASIYVCKPSETDPTVAPEGCENLFVLVPVPADVTIGRGGDSGQGSEAVERAADAAIDQVAAWAGVPLCATASGCGTPWGPRTSPAGTTRGAAARSASSTRSARAPSSGRPTCRRRSTGCCTPGEYRSGVGLPMCLISAELVLKRLSGIGRRCR
jgi:phytoene desaturase